MTRQFSLEGKVAVITGANGLLGRKHAEAIREAGGTAIMTDVEPSENSIFMDVTDIDSIRRVSENLNRVDILINNAAINPKMVEPASNHFENFSLDRWNKSLEVNLTGAFLCSQVFIKKMINNNGGVVLNIASDLGVIAPDHRIYKEDVKPVDYSVTKHALIGLTKYIATYYADRGIRANSLSPAGVRTDRVDPDFESRLTNLIPMGRMATPDEYKGAIIFLCSAASSYMTGANLIIDGGRTVW